MNAITLPTMVIQRTAAQRRHAAVMNLHHRNTDPAPPPYDHTHVMTDLAAVAEATDTLTDSSNIEKVTLIDGICEARLQGALALRFPKNSPVGPTMLKSAGISAGRTLIARLAGFDSIRGAYVGGGVRTDVLLAGALKISYVPGVFTVEHDCKWVDGMMQVVASFIANKNWLGFPLQQLAHDTRDGFQQSLTLARGRGGGQTQIPKLLGDTPSLRLFNELNHRVGSLEASERDTADVLDCVLKTISIQAREYRESVLKYVTHLRVGSGKDNNSRLLLAISLREKDVTPKLTTGKLEIHTRTGRASSSVREAFASLTSSMKMVVVPATVSFQDMDRDQILRFFACCCKLFRSWFCKDFNSHRYS